MIDYKDKLEKQQKKFDELLRECEKYRNDHEQLIEYQIELENMKKDTLKFEKRNKLLSDQIVELTYNNVQLEKEINDYSEQIDEQHETINILSMENQKLMNNQHDNKMNVNINENDSNSEREPNKATKRRLYSQYGGAETSLDRFVSFKDNNTMDLKRRLSVQLRDNFGYNEKLVMFANNIDENGSMDGSNRDWDENMDGIDENYDEENLNEEDLFTIHQNYENNEEYLQNNDIDNMTNGTGTDHGDRDEREESLSDLSDKIQHKLHTPSDDGKINEEEEKAESLSPKANDDIAPIVLANKSREEKALDPKSQRKGIFLYAVYLQNVILYAMLLICL